MSWGSGKGLAGLASAGLTAMAASTAVVGGSVPMTTFSEHVAPIVFKNCSSCHRPGEAAPFSFLTYDDVRKRGRLIVSVIEDRFMPPWHAETGPLEFLGERRLSEEEIQTISTWVESGMALGDPKAMPPVPDFPVGWQLGEPDLIVRMDEAFEVPAEGPDIYRHFVLPLDLPEDKWVTAIEFRPGARSVVHHCLFFTDTTGRARKADAATPLPGFTRMGSALRGSGRLGGWAVGGNPRLLPEGLAQRLPKGADLVLQTHFHPSGKVEKEQSTVGLYFTEKAPKQSFAGVQLPPSFGALSGLDIPAGEANHALTDSFVLPVDVKAFAVSAHAHYLGKDMVMTATWPDGETRELLSIPEWDFSWQEQYTYKEMVSLPKGTRLNVTIHYDNSEENPNNPSDPPVRVRWGRESTDEMGSMTLRVIAENPSEMPILRKALKDHSRDVVRGRISDRISSKGGRDLGRRWLLQRLDRDGDGELSDEERAAGLRRLGGR